MPLFVELSRISAFFFEDNFLLGFSLLQRKNFFDVYVINNGPYKTMQYKDE